MFTLKKNFTAFILLTFYIAPIYILAEENPELNFTSELSKNRIKMGENVILTVTISGAYKVPPEIKLPNLSDFTIISSNQYSSYNIKEKKYEAKTKYEIHLLPKKPGTFSIGPIELHYARQVYKTQILTLEVLPSKEYEESPLPKKEIPWKDKKGIII
ncbi:MAG: BatD family protein [Candidatus Omnitrophica bacterium]|nr:BatD family protein [Candidatus Omnitrophota bacterium]